MENISLLIYSDESDYQFEEERRITYKDLLVIEIVFSVGLYGTLAVLRCVKPHIYGIFSEYLKLKLNTSFTADKIVSDKMEKVRKFFDV